MYIELKDLIEKINELKNTESKIIRLNGNDQKAVNERMKKLEKSQDELTAIYNSRIFELELKKIALYEVSYEILNEKIEDKSH